MSHDGERNAASPTSVWPMLTCDMHMYMCLVPQPCRTRTGPPACPPIHIPWHHRLWLVCDGTATCVGMLLGLVVLLQGVQVARGVETQQWVLPDGEERDARADLTGAFRAVSRLSDGVDVALVLLFVLGWYAYYAHSGEGGCDILRSWVWWGLVMKLLAPIGLSLASKCLGGPPERGDGLKKQC